MFSCCLCSVFDEGALPETESSKVKLRVFSIAVLETNSAMIGHFFCEMQLINVKYYEQNPLLFESNLAAKFEMG